MSISEALKGTLISSLALHTYLLVKVYERL